MAGAIHRLSLTRPDACPNRISVDYPHIPSHSRPLSSTSTMDISFALTGKGYVIVASDTTAARSIVKMKIDEDKIKELSPHLIMAYSGEPGAYAGCLYQ